MASCPNDWPLFSSNETEVDALLAPLRTFQRFYEPIHGFLCAGICSFGVATNLIHILILTRPNMRTSAVNVIMTAVALCDIGTMVSYIVYIVHFVLEKKKYSYCNPSLYSWSWMFFLMWHISISIALHTASLWLAVAMAFVRLMTLRHARLYSKWQQAQNAWKICLLIFLAIFLLCVPTILSHEIIPSPGFFMYVCDDFDLGLFYNATYQAFTINIPQVAKNNNCKLYKANLWLTGIVFKVVPCVLLGYLSANLLKKLRDAETKRRRLFNPLARTGGVVNASAAGRRTDHTTILLISIVLVFLITELPQGAIAIMNAIFTKDVTRYIYFNFGDILDLLSLVNSCVNFVLYSIMSSRYRQTFCHVVLPRRIYVRIFLSPQPPEQTELAMATTTNFSTNVTTTPLSKKSQLLCHPINAAPNKSNGIVEKNGYDKIGESPTLIRAIDEDFSSSESICSPDRTPKSIRRNVEFRFDDYEFSEEGVAFCHHDNEKYPQNCDLSRKTSSNSSVRLPKFLRTFSMNRRRPKSARNRNFREVKSRPPDRKSADWIGRPISVGYPNLELGKQEGNREELSFSKNKIEEIQLEACQNLSSPPLASAKASDTLATDPMCTPSNFEFDAHFPSQESLPKSNIPKSATSKSFRFPSFDHSKRRRHSDKPLGRKPSTDTRSIISKIFQQKGNEDVLEDEKRALSIEEK